MINDALLENYTIGEQSLPIIFSPHPTLTQKASEVEAFDESLHLLARKMLNSMYEAPGIGLAAPQVDLSLRMFVMDVDFAREEVCDAEGNTSYKLTGLSPHVLINPVIKEHEGKSTYEEGCLSIPGIYAEVTRPEKVLVEYRNLSGDSCELEADGLLATCLQHELDHLNGILLWDHLSPLKKNLLVKKWTKMRKRMKESKDS